MQYIGKRCWQSMGYARAKVGTVVELKTENKWLLLKIQWDGSDSTWEKICNLCFDQVSFESLSFIT